MEPTAATTLSAWLRRFACWFFNVSPDAVAEPPPSLPAKRRRTKARRRLAARLRAHHAGRIHIIDRKRT
jgi:hypothetical protein